MQYHTVTAINIIVTFWEPAIIDIVDTAAATLNAAIDRAQDAILCYIQHIHSQEPCPF